MPDTNLTGRSLKQYQLVARLGAGGMGEVYRARDAVLGRDAAIKVLPPDKLLDLEARQRFLREARAASALNHPNVVTVYEIGQTEGIDFIAMELVPGESLQSKLSRCRPGIVEAADYAAQAAAALARAHAVGVIHRDIKPGNLVVTPDGLVKVLDFGLARLNEGPAIANDNDPTNTAMFATRAGLILGTLAYMSPEQARGEEAGAPSDVFSLGIVLFEMLSGQRPFAGTSELALLHNLHFSPPLELRQLSPDVPPELAQTAARMLEKDPSARPTMAEVREQLRKITAPDTSQTVAAAAGGRAASRTRSALVAAAVIATVGAAGLGLSRIDWTRFERAAGTAATSAIDPAATPRELYVKARALLDRFDREENPAQAIVLLERAVERDPEFALGYATVTEAYHYRNQVAPDPQWPNLMSQSAQRAVALNPELAAAHIAMGIALSAEGKVAEADAAFHRAADLDPRSSAPYRWLAVATRATTDTAAEYLQRALTLDPGNWTLLQEAGVQSYRNADYRQAAAYLEAARTASPDNVRVLSNLAAAYHMLDRYDDAASTLQRAIEIEPAPRLFTNLGTLRFFQGRYDEAVAPLERAVELAPNRYLYWANLADAYRWSPGHKAKAAGAYARAIAMVRAEIAKKPDDPDLQSRLALYLAKSGDTAAALATLRPFERQPPTQGAVLFRIGVTYEVSGVRDKALTAFGQALKAGYSETEIRAEPELLDLRNDVRYHRMLAPQPASGRSDRQ